MLELNTSLVAGGTGTTAIFKDITGTTAPNSYGKSGNITYSDVDAVRLKTSTLSSIETTTVLEAGDSFTQYVEYICTDGNGTIDGKGISVGEYFVPQISGLSVPSNMEFEATGYYVYPILATWLPTANETALTLSLSQLNQSGSTTLEDSVYTIEYEVYKDRFTGTQAAVDGQSYMVLSSTATYDGNTYRAGEVFIATDTTNIVAAGNVVLLAGAVTQYFTITWNILQSLFDLVPFKDVSLQESIFEIRLQLEGLENSCATNNVSYEYSSQLIERIQKQVTALTFKY